MRNIALRLAYDGGAFAGSQWQADVRTVQGELEAAWERLTQERRRFVLAGRTDCGVHAQGQVANVRSDTAHRLPVIQRALNALLPRDMSVLAVWEVPAEFHARRSAVRRWYRYLIDNQAVGLPLLRHVALHVATPLDVAAMQAAVALLVGEHDFAAFASRSEGDGSTVRRCERAVCVPVTCVWSGRTLLAIDLVANAFLYHMVRTIVGTLLLVGQGRLSVADVAHIRDTGERRLAGPTAAPHGLILMAVDYPDYPDEERR